MIGKETTRGYDIYPFPSLGKGKINRGYTSLTDWIIKEKNIRIDGYAGVLWSDVQQSLEEELQKRNISVSWIKMADMMKPAAEIQHQVEPFLGEAKAVWGTKCTLNIADFFKPGKLPGLKPDEQAEVSIAIGTGSALLNWNAPIVYLDLPKNEIQYRSRAGAVTNFGNDKIEGPAEMYKRSYFVDWPILNAHKQNILDEITIVADAQWKESINWLFNTDLKKALHDLSRSVFRVRPCLKRAHGVDTGCRNILRD